MESPLPTADPHRVRRRRHRQPPPPPKLNFPWRAAFLVLCLGLFAGYAMVWARHAWLGDFWHHLAFVRAIADAPLSRANPFTGHGTLAIPYWPYNAFLAWVSHATGLAPIHTPAAMGTVNLALFCAGVYRFSNRFLGGSASPSIALLCLLTLWGSKPWVFSGMFHLGSLFWVAPYPSTFAGGLSLLALSGYLKSDSLRPAPFAGYTAVATLVLLIHPITFLFYSAFVCALAIPGPANTALRRGALTLLQLGIAAGMALIWPFFPLRELIGAGNYTADPTALVIYEDVLARCWPALAGLAVLVGRLRRDPRDPLGLTFLALLFLYVYGYTVGAWNYGRGIAYMALLLQMSVAGWLASRITGESPRTAWLQRPFAWCCVLVLCGLLGLGGWTQARKIGPTADLSAYANLKFLERYDPRGVLLLSDARTSKTLVGFGFRVVAFGVPPFFGAEYESRTADLDTFFADGTPSAERSRILEKYGAGGVVLNKNKGVVWEQIVAGLQASGANVLFQNSQFVLIGIPGRTPARRDQ
jgi:hypothetical protein